MYTYQSKGPHCLKLNWDMVKRWTSVITKFLNNIKRLAKSSNWADADMVIVTVLKLSRAAVLFLNSNGEATRDDTTFARLREIFTKWFKHLDQFHYNALKNAVQYQGSDIW